MDNKINTKNKENTMEMKINIILLIISAPIGIYEIVKIIKEKKMIDKPIKNKKEYERIKVIIKILKGIKLKGQKEEQRIELIKRGEKIIEEYEKRTKND